MALELIPHGNLRLHLRKIRFKDESARQIFTPEKLLEIAKDVANGMRHLSDIGVRIYAYSLH